MKHSHYYYLICYFILSAFAANAQDSLKVNSNAAIVSADKMNVFYLDLENPISTSLFNEKEVILTINNGKIVNHDGRSFAIPERTGDCVITLYNHKKTNCGEFHFRVKNLPLPTAMIYNKNSGIISKRVLASGVLTATLENFDFEIFYRITSFKTEIKQSNGDICNYSVAGNQLTEELKACILELNSNDSVYFYDIKCHQPQIKKEMPLQAILFTIL